MHTLDTVCSCISSKIDFMTHLKKENANEIGEKRFVAYPNITLFLRTRNYCKVANLSISNLICIALKSYLDKHELDVIQDHIEYVKRKEMLEGGLGQ